MIYLLLRKIIISLKYIVFMEKIYIDYKRWSNAKAFITLTDNQISVCGKFYDGFRDFPGPEVEVDVLSDTDTALKKEIKARRDYDYPMSKQLRAYVNDIWRRAQKLEPLFSYSLD